MNTVVDRRGPTLLHDTTQRVRQALFDAVFHFGDHAARPQPAPLKLGHTGEPIAPAVLAESQPPVDRDAARAMYERCLAHYREHVRLSDPDADPDVDDAALAVAYFVAANMQALSGVQVTQATLQRLKRQLAMVARLTSRWDTAGPRERQIYFEKMAILSVLMDHCATQALQRGAERIAHVQHAARAYLHELFGLDPDQLVLDAGGLSLRRND